MNRQQAIKDLLLSIRNWTLSTAESRFLYAMAQIAEQTPVMGSLQVLELFRDCAKGDVNTGKPVVVEKLWPIPQKLYNELKNTEVILTQGAQSENEPFASNCEGQDKELLELLDNCYPV